jgi:hypothetical protein
MGKNWPISLLKDFREDYQMCTYKKGSSRYNAIPQDKTGN